MKILMSLLASIISVWLFYFLVSAFFVQSESIPAVLVFLANLLLFVFSRNVKHVISRLFFLMSVESLVVPLAAFIHTLASDHDFLQSLQKEGQSPALIQYFLSSGYDTQQLVMTSLGFTTVCAIFAYFLSPERDTLRY